MLPINTLLKVYTCRTITVIGFFHASNVYKNINQAINVLLVAGCHLAPPFLRNLSDSRLDTKHVLEYWDTLNL